MSSPIGVCNSLIAQANVAFNHRKGTLRGMHFQVPPAAETKLVRCTRGAILDIIVDLRPESPTWLRHIEVELNEDNHRALFVPERFAHGYQVLTDRTETSYQVGEFYSPPNERALRYDDPHGHTHLFTGDSLFPGGVGNTWGDADRFASLIGDVEAKIFDVMADDTIFYPGHGKDSTLGAERPSLPEWHARGW